MHSPFRVGTRATSPKPERRTRRAIHAFALLATASLVAALTGCGGASFGGELSATPAPYMLGQAQQARLAFPAKEPFSIRLPQSSEQAGLNGTADAVAEVQRDGAASASAKADNGGKASAGVQVGHAFKNDSTRQMDLTIRMHYRYEYSLLSKPDPRQAGATVGIRLFAKDERSRVLRDIGLVTQSTVQGAAIRQSDDDVTFTVTLGPSQSMAIYLAGQAAVEVVEGRSAEAALKIRDLKLDVETQVSPAVAPASAPASPIRAPAPSRSPASSPVRR